jgi:hypothetical protein
MSILRYLSIFFLSILIYGCGYRLIGKETHIPPGISSIAISTFINKTYEPGIEIPFTRAFLKEFIEDRRLRVVSRNQADSILEGVIKSFELSSVSYDRSGFVMEYQTTIVMDIVLKKKTGETIWSEENLSETRWYRTSSNILMSETNKFIAIEQTAKYIAERIRNRFFYNF